MRLEEFWGIGPKTAALLRESIGEADAIAAIETADIRTLAAAGVPRGRAVRILRRATGTDGIEVLGTGDTRDVYDELLTLASEYALTTHAADRIRVLTPLPTQDAMADRLDRVLAVRAERDAAADLNDAAFDIIETVRGDGVRDMDELRSGVVDHIASETGIEPPRVRSAAADDAVDAADFVSQTLRALVDSLETAVDEREATVAADLQDRIDAADAEVTAVVTAIGDIALELSLGRFAAAFDLRRPTLVDDGLAVRNARNLFVDGDVQPITYAVGSHGLTDTARPLSPPTDDRVAVLTGANSGGKTTLLETLSQVALLAAMGLPVPADDAEVGGFETIVFHRRHASFNAGVLESTLKSIVPPLTDDGRTLMLVDEFEAITEPGRAADLLNGLVSLTVDQAALGVYVTHLADDLSPLPETARIDGIFAEGLDPELELQVDYQPRFGTVGKSTPEFIVSRLVANATDRAERAGFESLAAAVGEEAVQRTLSDVEWQQ